MSRNRFKLSAFVVLVTAFALGILAACGGTETVIQTVVVEKPGQTITERVVETVVVEKQVTRTERVVETVVVQREVEGKTVTVVETVVVEKPVTRTEKVVETVVVEKAVQVVATPTPDAMAMMPKGEESTVTVADSSVFPVIFVHALSALGQEWKVIGWDIGENLLRVDANGNYDPDNSIARSFEVAPDNTSITFQLRDDVMFHQTPGGTEVGGMTAHDVAWSFNNSGRADSIFYRAGSVRDWMGDFDEDGNRTTEPFDVIDDYTVRLNWRTGKFLPWWVTNLSQTSSADPWITSKTLVDQLGEAKASQVPVATGPYRAANWSVGERMDLVAVEGHWRQTPAVKNFVVLELREPQTVLAAFKIGQIDFAPIPNSLLGEALDATPGSRRQAVGQSQMGCINFTGNYWQMKNNNPDSSGFGETIFPREGFNPENAWVGDPRDADSMEQARKVRRALILAIDREAIRDELFGGFGGIQGSAVNGWGPDSPGWKTDWERNFDPDEARALIAEAGYGDGFDIPLFVPSDHPRVNPEAGRAIAQMWNDVGANVDLDVSAYAAARPRRFNGVDDIPWYHCGTIRPGLEDRPFDGGMGPTSTFRGFEVEDHMVPLYFANFTEPDRQKRIENNIMINDYVLGQWELQTAFVADIPHYAVGPRIGEWVTHSIDAPIFTGAGTVTLK